MTLSRPSIIRVPWIRVTTLLALLLLFSPGLAQSPQPFPSHPLEKPVARPPKTWVPRLAKLPYRLLSSEAMTLAGRPYRADAFHLTFFEGTPPQTVKRDVKPYAFEETTDSASPRAFTVLMKDPDALLAAVDAFNDLSEVKGAELIPLPDFGDQPVGANAGANGEPSLWPGDYNGDLRTNVADVVGILHTIVGIASGSDSAATPAEDPYLFTRCDVDRSGTLTVRDAVAALWMAAGMGIPPPYGYAAAPETGEANG